VSEFDRIRPPGARLWAPADEAAAPDPAGRAALFSPPTGARSGGEAAALELHCSRCGTATPLALSTLLRAALPLFLVVPWRRHPLFAVCPACRRRAWLQVTAAGGARG
jgi:hypothetical protein